MDIIEIDSSESDDDILIGRDLPKNPSNNGASTSRLSNGVYSACMPNIDRSNGFFSPQIDEEITSWTSNGTQKRTLPPSVQPTNPWDNLRSKNDVRIHQHNQLVKHNNSYDDDLHIIGGTQKRTLPLSFQPLNSWNNSRRKNEVRIPQHSLPMKHNNSYGEDLHILDDYINKNDINVFQHTLGRTLPPFPQTGKMISPHEYESNNQHFAPSASMNENANFGKQRILPPSLSNGKHVYNPQASSSYAIGDHVNLADQRVISEHDETAIYQEILQNLWQPNLEDDLPSEHLSVTLLKHQKIALAWMVNKEKSLHCAGGILADDQGLGKTISMIALIQKQRDQQKTFKDPSQMKTEAVDLDDDGDDLIVDLDKKPSEVNKIKEEIPSTLKQASGNSRHAAGTLVVCPASILRQWARELDEKVPNDKKLSVLVYHGGSRTKDPAELANYDVVITTYAIVANEVPKQNSNDNDDDREQRNSDYNLHPGFSSKKKLGTRGRGKRVKKSAPRPDYDSGPLARVRWFRVILDEAQTIKNHRTQVAGACSGLRAKRRWCLSGTPIQNSIDDLYSYFRFLKYDPYSVYSSFCSMIKNPISRNSENGYKKLQAVLRTMLLRRTKDTKINGKPIINLPSKSVFLKKADFSPEERSFYLRLEGDSRQQFKKYAAAGTVSQNYASILLMLLRLRQACDHPVLVKGYGNSDIVGKESLEKAKKLNLDMQYNLLLKLEAFAICGVCNDPPEDAVVTMCGHVFCYQCVSERLTGYENTCPSLMCKASLSPSSVFSRATLQTSISGGLDNNVASSSGLSPNEEVSVVERTYVSSKIKAAVEILTNLSNPCYNVHTNECDGTRPNTEPVKAIVFSQWTGMLDLLELSLNQSLIQYRRLDGSMSLPARDNAVKDFNTDPEVTVMIMSLKAGNLGLNMVAACHVILLDLWWNPTTEDQAVDRAHRIGQTRPVTVSRLTIKDTVEDRILILQEEKRKMASAAFGEDGTGSRISKLTAEDFGYLFKV